MRALIDIMKYTGDRPGIVLKRNVIGYLIFQIIGWAGLMHAVITHSPRTITILIANMALPPFFIWTTYRECRTAWEGRPANEEVDMGVPLFVTLAAALLLRALLHNY